MQPPFKDNIDCLSVGILVADHLCDPIERIPTAGELIICPRLPLSIGGCASNTAVDLARLGVRAGVVGCVGQDYFGRFIIDTLAAAGIDVRDIRQLADTETSGTLIINVRGEDRRFIHAAGANARLEAAHIPLDRVRGTKVLYVGGYLLMPALEGEPLASLFRQARAAGVKTVLDIVIPRPGDHWRKLESVLAETDVFLPNHDEAASLTGFDDPVKQAQRFVSAGAGAVVITCGGEGSVAVSGKERLRAPAHRLEYKGGTGAGDAFDAGFITGLLLGEDLAGCLRWGSAIGASCVRSISATESVFNRQEAETFMHAHPLLVERF
ncbi:MAG: carbohydrate kinase family protein [Planctomycetia bacterium]|nr:carbohydrate kinase family protein [Planctomycetia bacterium]